MSQRQEIERLKTAAFPNGCSGPAAKLIEAYEAAITERDEIIESNLCAGCDAAAKRNKGRIHPNSKGRGDENNK
jgi:hypothetical protein